MWITRKEKSSQFSQEKTKTCPFPKCKETNTLSEQNSLKRVNMVCMVRCRYHSYRPKALVCTACLVHAELQPPIWYLHVIKAGTLEQKGGYNFSIKEKKKKQISILIQPWWLSEFMNNKFKQLSLDQRWFKSRLGTRYLHGNYYTHIL